MVCRGAPAAAVSEPNKEKEEVSEGVRGALEDEIVNSKAAPPNSVGVFSDNGRSSQLVRVRPLTSHLRETKEMVLLDWFVCSLRLMECLVIFHL